MRGSLHFQKGSTTSKISWTGTDTMRIIILAAILLWATTVWGDTHVPSLTISGSTITIDADYIGFDPQQDMTGISIVEGVLVIGPRQACSSDGISPIIWTVPPGTYTITAHGFPDDPMNPNRNAATLTAVVAGPSRQEQINDAYRRFFQSRDSWQQAKSDLRALNPTRQETLEALGGVQ